MMLSETYMQIKAQGFATMNQELEKKLFNEMLIVSKARIATFCGISKVLNGICKKYDIQDTIERDYIYMALCKLAGNNK